MNKLSPLVKVPLRYGAIAGVLGSVLTIALYYMGKHPLLFPVYFDFRIILFGVFMFFTLKEYRDGYKDGLLAMWEGLIACFLFVTVFALVASVSLYFFATIEKNFIPSFVTLFTEQVMKNPEPIVQQIGKEAFDSNLKALSATTAYDVARNYFNQSYLISFFISIILSVVLRKTKT